MASEKKPPKVLWMCPYPEYMSKNGNRYSGESRRTTALLPCSGCMWKHDCPGPVKYNLEERSA